MYRPCTAQVSFKIKPRQRSKRWTRTNLTHLGEMGRARKFLDQQALLTVACLNFGDCFPYALAERLSRSRSSSARSLSHIPTGTVTLPPRFLGVSSESCSLPGPDQPL